LPADRAEETFLMRLLFFSSSLVLIFFVFQCGSETSQAQKENNSDSATVKSTGAPGRMGPQKEMSNTVPVEVTPVIRGEISSYLLYNSTLETEEMADVYSRIPGLIEKLYVEEGQVIRKDQPLLQIEEDEYQLEEEKAKLQYDKQRSEYERFTALKDKNLVSVEEYETARLNLRQAELQWKQAKLNLDYTIVRSPIDGVIGERFVRLGDRIQMTTRLFVISNPQDKLVKIYVPQDELPKCYIDQSAMVFTDVLSDQSFIGWVKRISPIVDPTSGTFKVTVGIQDSRNQLRPGMFVSVRLIVDTREQTLLLPKASLVYENERTYFFLVESDSVKKIELKKGFEDAEKVEVLNEIPDTSRIVVVGQTGLKEGSKIKIVQQKSYPWQQVVSSLNFPNEKAVQKGSGLTS
jgi:RND family efflux transporter MFP subunit